MNKENYQKSIKEITSFLNVDENVGLSTFEVLKRQQEYGKNILNESKKVPFITKLLRQFKDFMIVILLVAALISVFVAKEYASGFFIVLIVVINALIGATQEEKAENSLKAIKDLSSPHTTVIRDGLELIIDVKDVVVGDIVLLKTGDFVPADVRIIETVNLQIDESTLTGESVPVNKTSQEIKEDNVSLGDRSNSAYMGTLITYGKGKAVVTEIGTNTEIGKIALVLASTEKDLTPLQKSISGLGKTLALVALSIVSFIFLIEIIEGLYLNLNLGFINALKEIDWLDAFLFAVSLAVAAIPEGLPAIITIVLALGMQTLVKEKAIVKTLPAVETLGSTEIICSDKTGTLTKNVMTVESVYLDGEVLNIKDISTVSSSLNDLVTYSILVNDAKIRTVDNEKVKIGEPTELALIELGLNLNLDPQEISNHYKRVFEYPFDSKRKLMSTINIINGKKYAIIKGAPEIVFNKVNSYKFNNEVLNDKSGFDDFSIAAETMTNKALRVLAIAIKEIDNNIETLDLTMDFVESDLTLVGLVGIIDPPRTEVKESIQTCIKAGIKTIMITGDHKNTAKRIAEDLNIYKPGDIILTGQELDLMSDEEFSLKIEKSTVFARVSPENKVRIVKAFKDKGHVVAMTGDGVNDAPSVKQADIGIAMGITGTEVTKGASDMILTDDNFSTIVKSISTGRTIFANIKKVIHFLLSCNVGEILAMFLGVTVGILIFKEATSAHILIPTQILWVNLVTDSFLAIALGMELKEKDVMDKKPRDSKKSIFAGGLGFKIFWQGMLIGILTFSAYLIGYFMTPAGFKEITAQTMAFMVLSLSQLTHALNARSEVTSVFKLKISKPMILALITSFTLQMIVFLPFLRDIFNVALLSGLNWLVIITLSLMPLLVVETQKFIAFKFKKNKNLKIKKTL